MNKPLQNILDLCGDEALTKSKDALTKTYEQHLKALNDLRNAAKKAMADAVMNEDFSKMEEYKALLERTKVYIDALEGLVEPKLAKAKIKKSDAE